MTKTITVVIPAHNEAGNISKLVEKLHHELYPLGPFEIIFVDDGSTDESLREMKRVAETHENVRYLSLSRNFGHQIALKAGMDHAEGDCVISMDADLEHPPALVPRMIAAWQNGFDVVTTKRRDHRKVGFIKKKTSRIFYWFFNAIADVNLHSGAADFRLLDRKVVEAMKMMNEPDPFLRGIIAWMGYKQKFISYQQGIREHGQSKYNILKMMQFSLSGITNFSIKPLHLSTVLGAMISMIAFVYGVYALSVKIFTQQAVDGWTSLIASVLFIGGIQLVMIGIIGLYLGKVFIQTKQRPQYLIKEHNLAKPGLVQHGEVA